MYAALRVFDRTHSPPLSRLRSTQLAPPDLPCRPCTRLTVASAVGVGLSRSLPPGLVASTVGGLGACPERSHAASVVSRLAASGDVRTAGIAGGGCGCGGGGGSLAVALLGRAARRWVTTRGGAGATVPACARPRLAARAGPVGGRQRVRICFPFLFFFLWSAKRDGWPPPRTPVAPLTSFCPRLPLQERHAERTAVWEVGKGKVAPPQAVNGVRAHPPPPQGSVGRGKRRKGYPCSGGEG